MQNFAAIGRNRDCDCVDLEKWPRFLSNVSRKLEGYAGPKSQNGKINFNEVYQYSNSTILPVYCVLKIGILLWL